MALGEYEIELNGLPATVQLDEKDAKSLGLIATEEETPAPKTSRKARTPRKAAKAQAPRPLVLSADTVSDPGASE